MTYCLPIEVVLEIHAEFADGGALLQRELLESALARPLMEPFGYVPYPTVAEKAAVLLEGLATAHAFFGANKRTAWSCCVTYLALNGIELVPVDDEEVAAFVVAVVEHKVSLVEIAEWLITRTL